MRNLAFFSLFFLLLFSGCAGAGNSGTNNTNNNINNNINNTNNTNNCNTCTPGHQRCVDGKLQTCAEHTPCPVWENTENCSSAGRICVANEAENTAECKLECVSECAAGESTCVENTLQECQEIDGCAVFVDALDCAAQQQICVYDGQTQTAACENQCTPTCTSENATRCQNNQVETCASANNCLQWASTADCTAQGKTCQMVGQNAVCISSSSTLNLFFSEYLEGTSNNKAVEIYVMSAPSGFNLSSCMVQVFSNGSTTPSSTINLSSAALTAGQTFVLCHTQWALSYTCDQLGNLNFNGDDAVKLSCSGTTMDVFGHIGEDPGDSWNGGGVVTMDATLRRKCSVTAGDTTESDPFDPSVEWTQASINNVSNLGVFTPCK